MRVVLDTCVLVPTFLRLVLLQVANIGQFKIMVSPHILEEWRRAGKNSMETLEADVAVTQFQRNHLDTIYPNPQNLVEFWLPDKNDIHVLALAVAQNADAIVTFNKKDFPKNELIHYGLNRYDPDQLLCMALQRYPKQIYEVLQPIVSETLLRNPDLNTKRLWRKSWLGQFGYKFEKLA
ncbi:MAG: PIN domain-containing protein, partial [Planktomarina sp.]|nr:PIN domain-containing protein [Planktomarina sp.]